jgi:hypothetical protein
MKKLEKLVELLQANNPFEYRVPVPKKELFIDREIQLRDTMSVCKQILGGSAGGILVHGGRGSGKTSFLDELKRRLDEESIVNTKLPLDEEMVAEGSEKRLFNTILQELISSATKNKILEQGIASRFINFLRNMGKIENVEIDFPGFSLIVKPEIARDQFAYIVLRDGLIDFLKLITVKGNTKGKCGVIIMFDEGDALLSNKTLLHILRNVFQEIKGVGLAIAGSTKLLDEVSEVFSPIPRFFHKVETGPYPTDSDVDNAVLVPINLCTHGLLMEHRLRLEIRHGGFDKIVREIAGRSPMDINLLGYFSYKNGAEEYRIYEEGKIVLNMGFDKKILDEAIDQLRGTKKYSEFIGNLDLIESNVLRLLSKATLKLSTKEVALLMVLDELQEALQTASILEITRAMSRFEDLIPNLEGALQSLLKKSAETGLSVLGFDILKKYDVEDNWIKAYFRYGWQVWNVDISVSQIPFIGIRFIGGGDCIASILFSTFFSRLAKCIEPSDAMKVHAAIGDGRDLYAWRGRRLIILCYKRTDDPRMRHIAFHLLVDVDAEPIKANMNEVMQSLTKLGFVKEFQIREDLRKVF